MLWLLKCLKIRYCRPNNNADTIRNKESVLEVVTTVYNNRYLSPWYLSANSTEFKYLKTKWGLMLKSVRLAFFIRSSDFRVLVFKIESIWFTFAGSRSNADKLHSRWSLDLHFKYCHRYARKIDKCRYQLDREIVTNVAVNIKMAWFLPSGYRLLPNCMSLPHRMHFLRLRGLSRSLLVMGVLLDLWAIIYDILIQSGGAVHKLN